MKPKLEWRLRKCNFQNKDGTYCKSYATFADGRYSPGCGIDHTNFLLEHGVNIPRLEKTVIDQYIKKLTASKALPKPLRGINKTKLRAKKSNLKKFISKIIPQDVTPTIARLTAEELVAPCRASVIQGRLSLPETTPTIARLTAKELVAQPKIVTFGRKPVPRGLLLSKPAVADLEEVPRGLLLFGDVETSSKEVPRGLLLFGDVETSSKEVPRGLLLFGDVETSSKEVPLSNIKSISEEVLSLTQEVTAIQKEVASISEEVSNIKSSKQGVIAKTSPVVMNKPILRIVNIKSRAKKATENLDELLRRLSMTIQQPTEVPIQQPTEVPVRRPLEGPMPMVIIDD
jgi:predicted amino acid-binding ACT domain protein